MKTRESRGANENTAKETKNMDLMNAICSSDYNQPNNRSASLKLTSRTQSKSINKGKQMAHAERSLKRLQDRRFSDYVNCCDNRILARHRPAIGMCWESIVLVFSVIVLINVASINCAAATRQVEGEFTCDAISSRVCILIFNSQ